MPPQKILSNPMAYGSDRIKGDIFQKDLPDGFDFSGFL
jgi:hypothetical protein